MFQKLFLFCLIVLLIVGCSSTLKRVGGFENNMEYYNVRWLGKPPPWLGNPRLHFSHRCNLVRKFPEHYGYIWNNVDPAIPYWWPVKLKSKKLQAKLDSFWNLISDEFILELLQI